MKGWRILLFPLGWLFGAITAIRRWLFDIGIFKRHRAEMPAVVIGNLTVGGTGKSPFTGYLAGVLQAHSPAVLSRGYGRKTSGFREVHKSDAAEQVGDEPLELRGMLPETVRNFVCENRLEGIAKIRHEAPGTGLVLLDDGFQHLRLLPDAALLLCDFNRPFWKDWPMPAGNLREFSASARFATAIVITKCPADFGVQQAMDWRQKLARYGLPVYFSVYENTFPTLPDPHKAVLLVTALAHNQAFARLVKQHYSVASEFHYPDHFRYTQKEMKLWQRAMEETEATLIVTTGKDAVKLRELNPDLPLLTIDVQPRILFGGEDDLIRLLLTKIDRNV